MSAFILSLVFACAAGGWLFTKLQQNTGYGNSSSAIKGAAIATALIFIFAFTVCRYVLHLN